MTVPATRKIGFAAALFVFAVLGSRVLGFARDAFIAAAFGANGRTDAFYAAFTLPDILNYLVAGGTLSITFIPIYTRHLAGKSEREGNRVFSIIVTVMTLVVVTGVALLEVWTPELAGRFLHKLRAEDLALAVKLTRILLPAQIFFYAGGLASATLLARHRFVSTALAPLVYSAGTILGGVLLGPSLGVVSLAWGTLAGAIVGPFAIQILSATRAGLRYAPRFDVKDREFVEWWKLTLPLMIGVSLVTADEWILRYFAAGDVGAISCLSYARKLVMVPVALAGQAVGQASMPFLARLHAEGDRPALGKLVTTSARASGAISALAAAGLAALAVPLVELLFRHGQFVERDVVPTAIYVTLFALAIPLWGIQGIVARAFYATGDTWTPMVAGTLVTLASLPVYALADHALGVAGLVIASDVGIFLHTAALLVLLPRRVPTCDRRSIVLGVFRAAALGALAAGAASVVVAYVPTGATGTMGVTLVRLVSGGAVFAVVVLALVRPFGVEDATFALDKIRKRWGRPAPNASP